jgi:GNAT superfamily N-acetyltransferase
VRTATSADAAAVADVHVRAWQVAYAGLLPAHELDALDPRERARRYDFDNRAAGAARTFVALIDGRIAGFATCGAQDGASGATRGELRALYIDPERWREGLGLLLLRRAEAHLRELGFDEAVLWVLIGNASAERFYLAHGWRADAVRRHERFWGVPVEVTRCSRAL